MTKAWHKAFFSAALLGVVGMGAIGCKSEEDPFPGQGVTADYRSFIPKTATKVAEGKGTVKWTATTKGTLYLVDTSRKEQTTEKTAVSWVAGSALLLKGQTIEVDGGQQKVTVGGSSNVTATTFNAKKLTAESPVELWFDPTVEK